MYYLTRNNEKTGPFTLEQLREMWRAGTIEPQALYWEQGMADWQPLARAAASLLNAPGALPQTAADPLSPVSTSHEPSAYDLPTSRLPATPARVRADPFPTAAARPAPTTANNDPGPLIAPTRLPSGGGGVMIPARPAAPMPPKPPGIYLSLIFALIAPVLFVFPVVGWLLGGGILVAAVVCGHAARAVIEQSDNRLSGKGIATAGLVLGYLGMVLGVLFVASYILAFSHAIIQGAQPPGVPR